MNHPTRHRSENKQKWKLMINVAAICETYKPMSVPDYDDCQFPNLSPFPYKNCEKNIT